MTTTDVEVIIEIPKGSRNKYEFDRERGFFRFDRMLFTPVHYPCDYGFVPDTLAEDGDPLDALVLLWEPTFPGCHIETKVLGVFTMWDEKGRDEKLLTVPVRDPLWNSLSCLAEVQPHLLREIEHFFAVYKHLEEKTTRAEGWQDRDEALAVIDAARRKFLEVHTTTAQTK